MRERPIFRRLSSERRRTAGITKLVLAGIAGAALVVLSLYLLDSDLLAPDGALSEVPLPAGQQSGTVKALAPAAAPGAFAARLSYELTEPHEAFPSPTRERGATRAPAANAPGRTQNESAGAALVANARPIAVGATASAR